MSLAHEPTHLTLTGLQTISHDNMPEHNELLRLEGHWLTLANGARIERSRLSEACIKDDPSSEYYRNKPSPISFFITLISLMALYAMLRADGPHEWPLGQATLPLGITGLAIGLWLMITSIKASKQTLTNLVLPEAASDIVLLQTADKQWAETVLARCTGDPSLDNWLVNNSNKTIVDIE